MDHAMAFHVQSRRGEILQARRVGEIHEDLIVKLPHVIDRLVERDVQHLAPANGVIDGDSHQKRRLAESMPGDDDSDISRAESSMDRVFEQPQWITFTEFFAVHNLYLAYSSSSSTRPVPYFSTSSL